MSVSQDFLEELKHGTVGQRAEFIKLLTTALRSHPMLMHDWVVIVDYPERLTKQNTVNAVWPTSLEVAKKAVDTMPVWFEHNAIQEVLKQLVAAIIKHIVDSGWMELMPDTVKVCVIRTNSLALTYWEIRNQVRATVIFDVQG